MLRPQRWAAWAPPSRIRRQTGDAAELVLMLLLMCNHEDAVARFGLRYCTISCSKSMAVLAGLPVCCPPRQWQVTPHCGKTLAVGFWQTAASEEMHHANCMSDTSQPHCAWRLLRAKDISPTGRPAL
jgi:hypothetical protein